VKQIPTKISRISYQQNSKLFTYAKYKNSENIQEQGGTFPSTKANALSIDLTCRKSSLEMGL
jgi:hypothetical protein